MLGPAFRQAGKADWPSSTTKESQIAEKVFRKVKGVKRIIPPIFVKEKGFTFPIYTIRGTTPAVFKTRGISATFIYTMP
jgi:hypothetical protein